MVVTAAVVVLLVVSVVDLFAAEVLVPEYSADRYITLWPRGSVKWS